jgi:vacuolar-type H+-ATPase subunit C/Vma6
VITTATLAYANARVRALKSRLLTPDDAALLRAAPDLPALWSVLREHGIEAADSRQAHAALLRQLMTDYEKVLRSCPSGRGLFLALLRLHEVENLKLAWRACLRSVPVARWHSLWRPLGRLATMSVDLWGDAGSLREALPRLQATPYHEIATAVLRAHSDDLLASELAFDRWANAQILAAAEDLPAHERAGKQLVRELIRERDLDTLRRAVDSYGLRPEVAIDTTVLLGREIVTKTLRRMLEWTPGRGPLAAHLPAWLLGRRGIAADWDDLILLLRRRRRRACQRSFLGWPFGLSAAVAYLLLREEEVRGLQALAEHVAARPRRQQPDSRRQNGAVLERCLAGSLMEM